MSPLNYLEIQWENLSRALKETLRNRYGTSTDKFYLECVERLDHIKYEIFPLIGDGQPNVSYLTTAKALLDALSRVVVSIERSHLEEFSWPFAYSLENVSTRMCSTDAEIDAPPLFFFGAKGGLARYEVRPEKTNSTIADQRIISVIFPRTLKNAVLLHAAIGHEIGHATIIARNELVNLTRSLVKCSVLEDASAFFDFCSRTTAVKERRLNEFLDSRAREWANEFLCDLIGLIMIGPAFLPAFIALLDTESYQKETTFIKQHPPFPSRVHALAVAAKHLNLLYSSSRKDLDIRSFATSLDSAIDKSVSRLTGPTFDLLNQDVIRSVVDELIAVINARDPSFAFPEPSPAVMTSLVECIIDDTPPMHPYPPAAAKTNAAPVSLDIDKVDFRHILLAGWMVVYGTSAFDGKRFDEINQLCLMAIMHQQALKRIDGTQTVITA